MRISNNEVILNRQYPIFAASPYGIGENFVVEIKCPTDDFEAFHMSNNGGMMCNETESQLRISRKRQASLSTIIYYYNLITYNIEAINQLIQLTIESWKNDIFPHLRDNRGVKPFIRNDWNGR